MSWHWVLLVLLTSLGCATAYPFTTNVACKAGRPNGDYLATNTGGDRIVGAYCEGVRCGRFQVFVQSDERIAEFPYENGVVSGEVDLWYRLENTQNYPSRHKARFNYAGGRRHGLSRYWCPNGLRLAEVTFATGTITDAVVWSCDGSQLSQGEATKRALDLLERDEAYFRILFSVLDEAEPTCAAPG